MASINIKKDGQWTGKPVLGFKVGEENLTDELKEKIANGSDADLSGYATKEELEALTAEDVGAAPAGYVVETGQYTNYADALARIKSVFTSMSNGEKRYMFVDVLNGSVWNGEFPSGAYFVEINREWTDYGIVEFTNNFYGKIVIRISGSWGDFCYDNPPVLNGVEYRTTERYNGKPVYVKKVDCGTFAVDTEVTWIERAPSGIVRAEANIADALPLTIGYNIGDIRQGVFVYNNKIEMYGETPGFINTLYVTIHYTKE